MRGQLTQVNAASAVAVEDTGTLAARRPAGPCAPRTLCWEAQRAGQLGSSGVRLSSPPNASLGCLLPSTHVVPAAPADQLLAASVSPHDEHVYVLFEDVKGMLKSDTILDTMAMAALVRLLTTTAFALAEMPWGCCPDSFEMPIALASLSRDTHCLTTAPIAHRWPAMRPSPTAPPLPSLAVRGGQLSGPRG